MVKWYLAFGVLLYALQYTQYKRQGIQFMVTTSGHHNEVKPDDTLESAASPFSEKNEYKIMAAIPCFNTEFAINQVVNRTNNYVEQTYVIDDGSSDNTSSAASQAGAIIITHTVNKGYGEAIKSCLETAWIHKADILVILDGDGQHNPDEIPQLVKPISEKKADMVIGSRFLTKENHVPFYRQFGINLITCLFNLLSKVRISDAQSGFRAYNRDILDFFHKVKLTETGMGISLEILIKAIDRGFSIKEVPISCLYHAYSSTLNPLVHGLNVALSLAKLRFQSALKPRGNF